MTHMFSSSDSTEYKKFSVETSPETTTPATGIPVSTSSAEYNYSSDQPKPRPRIQAKPQVPWSSGLFDCFSDVRNCCITLWCPCITFGKIAEIVDKGSS
ncbi:hypothetical protein RD792_011355 [Penstemon davidsonii]|uniref:Uncharacterized protein n=1 Tax=Penstemon davidsonii TaxID=160366 RepID=A0ABR0D551_9LAMI|nr:hypothetical protein RD792_011355 [Penstemon davidsonii]